MTFVKKVWKKLPLGLQQVIIRILCFLAVYKRDGNKSGHGPLYVVGCHRAATGLGVSARRYADEKEMEGKHVIRVDITREMLQTPIFSLATVKAVPLSEVKGTSHPGFVSLHANPPLFQLALLLIGNHFLLEKKLVAYWAWELEVLPPVYRHAIRYADAFEVPSSFVKQALEKETKKEVLVVPHPDFLPAKTKTCYAPDGILRCLFIFDMASNFERKNPLAAIDAFIEAFPDGGGELTLKVGQPESDPQAFEKVRQAAGRSQYTRIVTNPLSCEELESLYLANDVYLSLHRSEGYGLTIREAMLYGLHIVAIGWSGNMDFMHGPLAHTVPFTLVPVGGSGAMRGVDARWAEADINAAAEILKKLHLELTTAVRKGGE